MVITRNDDGRVTLSADRLPGGVWGSNLRAVLPATRWRALSAESARRAGDLCQVCRQPSFYGAGTRRPDCHELWDFQSTDGGAVQRLIGVVSLCGACHETQHSGLAELNGRATAVLDTLMRVNGVSQEGAEADVAESVRRYVELERTIWGLDLALLEGWVTVEGCSSLIFDVGQREHLGNTLDNVPRRLAVVVGAGIPERLWEW